MSSRLWNFLVQDIIDAIARIQGYVHDLNLDEFQQDRKTLDAVERNFIIIGEASGQIPRRIRDKFPLVPWRDMSDMLNYVAHNYWGIEVQQVWGNISIRSGRFRESLGIEIRQFPRRGNLDQFIVAGSLLYG